MNMLNNKLIKRLSGMVQTALCCDGKISPVFVGFYFYFLKNPVYILLNLYKYAVQFQFPVQFLCVNISVVC